MEMKGIHRYFCDVPVDAINGIRKSAVHVFLTKHRDGANLHTAPFTFNGPNVNSAGMFRGARQQLQAWVAPLPEGTSEEERKAEAVKRNIVLTSFAFTRI
jgi:hypothetical protein